jgi:hypothetical protein
MVTPTTDPLQVPVSSTPVAGTPWSEVKCEDGRVYFYNETEDVRAVEEEG